MSDGENMETIDALIASAEIGEQARQFLESDLGKCLIGIAGQQTQAALAALETVEPTDVKKIMELQNQAKLGRQFEQWLSELIQDGEASMEIYKNQQEQT